MELVSLLDCLFFFLDSRPLKVGTTGLPETSVRNYPYSLCNNPEEHSSQLVSHLFHEF